MHFEESLLAALDSSKSKSKESKQADMYLYRHGLLHAWIPLDWARAYFMLHEVEESAKAGREFFHRSLELQSPQAIGRAHEHLITLEKAGTQVERQAQK